jgi:hypothetical protein
MQEFSSISVSTYEPDSLVAKLNDESAAGWDVVAIVTTGSSVTAYLSRPASGDRASDTSTAAVATEPSTDTSSQWTPEAASEPAAAAPIAATAPVAQPAPEPAAVAATPAAEPAASASNAPAGWYADPSSRYDLRYWDGSTWTEHVSRAGQQYTDPPVA